MRRPEAPLSPKLLDGTRGLSKDLLNSLAANMGNNGLNACTNGEDCGNCRSVFVEKGEEASHAPNY